MVYMVLDLMFSQFPLMCFQGKQSKYSLQKCALLWKKSVRLLYSSQEKKKKKRKEVRISQMMVHQIIPKDVDVLLWDAMLLCNLSVLVRQRTLSGLLIAQP